MVMVKISQALKQSDDLLSKQEVNRHSKEGRLNHYDGHCYIAAEACYHLFGGKKSGWKSYVIPKRHIGLTTHWFLKKGDKIFDPTAKQFEGKIPYDKAVGCGFLTQKISKRAKTLLERIRP